MPRGYAPMRGVSGLAGLLGGGLTQQAADAEADRLLKQDATRGQIDLYGAQAEKARTDARVAQGTFDANMAARQRRSDPAVLAQMLAYRLGIPRETADEVVRQGTAAGLSDDQLQLAGETLAGSYFSSTADKDSGAGDLADIIFKAGSSAQRLRAPQVVDTNPNRAAFMLNAGTDKGAPDLHSALPGGIGTIGNFTGEQQYDPGLYQSRLAKERADANQSNAAAASSSATAARTRQQIEQGNRPQVFIDRGVQQLPDGSFAPIMVNDKPLGEKPRSGLVALPVAALKVQNEALEAIGTSSAIDADLGEIQRQIEAGELELGPLENLLSWGRNWSGMSSPNSRNYQSFRSTLEKMRNDSLRLNKGVQTEGDAVRAWNELLANINDQELVKQRLAEIREINRRGAELQKQNINVLRQNYGAEPLDTTPQSSLGAAVGAGRANTPRAGEVVDGYRFRGGDPANPESWEPIE